MSIWTRLRDAITNLGVANPLSEFFGKPPEKTVAFTVAIIALSAKMAKADGHVSRDEVRTLRQIFDFNEGDEREIAKVFDLARQDVAGFDIYAQRIAKLFRHSPEFLRDIYEALFQIAVADGKYHENEDAFLRDVQNIFELPTEDYTKLRNKYVPVGEGSCGPHCILGVDEGADEEAIRNAYRQIVRENHPDAMRARGLPDEAIAMAERRIRDANAAYDRLTNAPQIG